MAPGSFDCLLQTRGSNYIKHRGHVEIKCIMSSQLSLSDFHSFKSLVFSMCESQVIWVSPGGSWQRAKNTGEQRNAGF